MINDGECWGEHHDSPPSPSSLFTWDAGPCRRQQCGNQQRCMIMMNAGQQQQQRMKTTWHINKHATSSKWWQCTLSSLFTLVKVSDPPPPFLFSHKRQQRDNRQTMDKDDGQQPGEWCKSPLLPFFTQAAGAMSPAVMWQMTTDEGQRYTTTTNDRLEVSTMTPPLSFFQTRNSSHVTAGNDNQTTNNKCHLSWLYFRMPWYVLCS